MKILSQVAKGVRSVIDAAKAAADPGLFVSRPVLNGKDWEKWAIAAGVPSPLAAADIHVTICSSPIRVAMKPDLENMSITTDRACVCLLGPNENALAVVFESWMLLDRWWAFYTCGAMGSWSGFTPHLTLSYDAKDFQISDDALATMPEIILLGGEIYAPQGKPAVDDMTADNDDDEIDDVEVYVIEAALKAAGAEGISLIDEIELLKVAKTKMAPKSVAKRLTPADKIVRKTVEREVTITVAALPEEVRKGLKAAELFKANEEEHLIIGWASVATVKGVPVVDLQGDTITVKAQREFLHSLLRSQRASKFEHEGAAVNEVVGGIIMDADLQKALGIDLGMEGMLVEIFVPDDQNWEMVKSGDWMYSIAGTVLVMEDE